MSEAGNNIDQDWGKEMPPLQLPDEADIGRIAQLANLGDNPVPPPAQRAAVAAEQGWLKDLAPFFHRPTGRVVALRYRRVQDLALLAECFGQVAAALGMDQPAAGQDHNLELRLRECRIESSGEWTMEVNFPVKLEHCLWPTAASFVGVHFLHPVNFVGAQFLQAANFFAATFAGPVFFGGATFYGEADFRGATFRGEVNLTRANFYYSLDLKYAIFEEGSSLNVHELRSRGSTALGGNLSLGCRQIRRGSWPIFRGGVAGEYSKDMHDLAQACEQYGEMEANFSAQGSPDAAEAQEWCHYRYMDLRRRTQYRRWSPQRLIDWLFLKWCFGYGLHTKRILITGMLAMLFFALLYFTNGLGLPGEYWSVDDNATPPASLAQTGPWYARLGNALYFSAVTFTTIGYGDYHPNHLAKIAGAVEGMLGVFIMAVFTVAFSRKIIR